MPLPDGTPTSAEVLARRWKYGPIYGPEYDQAAAMERVRRSNGSAQEHKQTAQERQQTGLPEYIDWEAVAERGPTPPREWASENWLSMGHVTLLAGSGGVGLCARLKTTQAGPTEYSARRSSRGRPGGRPYPRS